MFLMFLFSMNFFFLITDSLTCSFDQFDCGHSVCIDEQLLCNDYNDCLNGLDELDCDGNLCFITITIVCPTFMHVQHVIKSQTRFNIYRYWGCSGGGGGSLCPSICIFQLIFMKFRSFCKFFNFL